MARRRDVAIRTPQPDDAWASLPAADALAALESRHEGLREAEARRRLDAHGPNTLPGGEPKPLSAIVLRQFRDPLIYILLGAVVLSLLMGDLKDAVFIGAVVVFNAAIGAYQEWRAEKGVHALQKLLRVRAAVSRDGEVVEMDAEAVVPGDVVWLESGNRVPADLRLLTTHGLEVDESLLTGESLGVAKDAAWRAPGDVPVSDRRNMAFAGCIVLRGRAQGVVVATGMRTQVGRVAGDVFAVTGSQPPLVTRMARFSRAVAAAVVVAALLLAGLGILQGNSVREMAIFAVALAVSTIPEGLPVALTVALAVGTKRMVSRQVIVRRLAAVEGLGSCTLIATDKTGTLTCNAITVRAAVLPDGTRALVSGQGFSPEGGAVTVERDAGTQAEATRGLERLALASALCNEASLHHAAEGWRWKGDPTDVALLAFAHKLGISREGALERAPQVNQIPFEPERRFAATFHAADGRSVSFVKGAPERVLAMCRDAPARATQDAEALAREGYRVLAVAEGDAPPLTEGDVPPEPAHLRFLGLVGMIDPPREGVREAVAAAKRAGLRVVMITGDHPVTALAIARDLGIATAEGRAATGVDLEASGEEGLPRLLAETDVFARVSPHHKLRIVKAAQAAGHLVAVTGDGVNDAPALRAADIGVAMGKGGTDVAREAADVVISDDNFASIVSGIEEGRVAYDNIRKVVFLLIANGLAEILLVILSMGAGRPLPLLPTQLLWLNLVAAGILATALAIEPGEADVLERRPRAPKERVFDRVMIERVAVAGAAMAAVGFLVFDRALREGLPLEEARNRLLLLMVLFETINIGNARTERRSALALSPLRNPLLLGGALVTLVVHYAATRWGPTQGLLALSPLPAGTWAALALASLSVFVAAELHKVWRRRLLRAREDVTTPRAAAPSDPPRRP